jgi:hypothetical protein
MRDDLQTYIENQLSRRRWSVHGKGSREVLNCRSSLTCTFPLTEAEQHAAGAAHVVLKRGKMQEKGLRLAGRPKG